MSELLSGSYTPESLARAAKVPLDQLMATVTAEPRILRSGHRPHTPSQAGELTFAPDPDTGAARLRDDVSS